MGMSMWGLFAAPLLAQAAPAPQDTTPTAVYDQAADSDIFSSDMVLDTLAMQDAAGGTEAALEYAGINIADNNAIVSDIDAANANTGQIANNVVSGNSLTIVNNNTGIGATFQNVFQLNIFLGGEPGN